MLKMKPLIFLFLIVLFYACNEQKAVDNSEKAFINEDTVKISQEELQAVELDKINEEIQQDRDNPDLYNERANFFIGKGDLEIAFDDINHALELDSSNADYYITLSDIHFSRGKFKPAVEALETAVRLDYENVEALLKLTEVSLIFNQHEKAVKYLDRVISIDDLDPRAYFLRGKLWLQKGDTVTGIKNFLEAINVDKEYYEAHMELGRLYASKNNELAVNYFKNASRIAPDSPEPLYHLGIYYQGNKETDLAIKAYEELLEIEPAYYFAWYNIGYIQLVMLEDYQAAIEYFDKALDINPNYTNAYYNKGYACELSGEIEEAIQAYENTLRINPEHDLAKKRLENLN